MFLVGCQPAGTLKPTDVPDVEIEIAAEEPPEEQPGETGEVTEPPSPEPTTEPIPTVNVPEISAPKYEFEPFDFDFDNDVPGSMNESGFYIDDQIILSGNPEDIAEVEAMLQDTGGVDINPDFGPYIIEFTDYSLEIGLYVLDLDPENTGSPGFTVWDVVYLVNNHSDDHNLIAFAEPNYVIVSPIGGSPRGGGSGIVGDPDGEPIALLNGQSKFINQLAFRSIHLYDHAGDYVPGLETELFTDPVTSTVEVAVFDTVHSELSDGNNYIHWAVIPFDLSVWKPGMIISETITISETFKLQDHGLYVVGLAQAISPVARYHLIEVLNADAKGDLFSLIRAMHIYTEWRRNQTLDQYLEDTVLNLSLGLAIEQNRTVDQVKSISQDSFDLLESRLEDFNSEDYRYLVNMVDKFPVVSLQIVLGIYDQAGAVVVAASGNDGSDWIQTPAAFPEVIGVASSNVERNKSCFSNFGNLAAPGGDGCSTQELSACDENWIESDCDPLVVVSLIYTDTSVLLENPSMYAYWSGTSFSAPLVSGLVALVSDVTSEKSPAEIQEIIYCSTDSGEAVAPSEDNPLGAGVINVQKALSENCIR